MTKQVQRRRGTAAQHTSFTGAEGEISVNTTNKSVHVHDGVTAGGVEAARADLDNVSSASVLSAAGITATATELNYTDGVTSAIQTQLDGKAPINNATFTGTTVIPTADINGGTIDGVTIGASAAPTVTNIDINGGTIDGTVIGGSTPAAISGTTGQFGTSLNVDGTVTADGLTVDNDGSSALISIQAGIPGSVTGDPKLEFIGATSASGVAGYANIYMDVPSGGKSDLYFQTAASGGSGGQANRMKIDGNGDISFYEDTGTTPKFFWDASAESLGIGTSSPTQKLTVAGNLSFTTSENSITWASGNGIVEAPSALFIRATGAGNVIFQTNGTERMRITSTGSVGIGTSSPSTLLELSGNNTASTSDNPVATIRLTDTDTSTAADQPIGKIEFYGNDGTVPSQNVMAYILSKAASTSGGGDLRFGTCASTAATEAMRIDASGNLLVGTTSAQGLVTIRPDGGSLGSVGFSVRPYSDTATAVNFRNASGTQVGYISIDSTSTVYNTSSDYRLKEDVQPMVGASDRVLALNPVNFAWKANGTRVDGFLAHEAQEVVPAAVTGEKDGEEMQAIDHSKLVPLLTAALQEALTEIADLKARVAALEA